MTSGLYRRLTPPGEAVDATEYVHSLQLSGRAQRDRPYVGLNMVASLDGRVTVAGRTAPLGGEADRELLEALRAGADALLVGAGTVRIEGYGAMSTPLVVASRSLDLPVDRGALSHGGNRVVVVTDGDGAVDDCAATVSYVRTSLVDALPVLRHEHGIEVLVCEGGPHLNATLLPAGVVDDLFLTISPQIVGGEDALRIIAGPELGDPVRATLGSALERDGNLFLRYELQTTGSGSGGV